MFKGECRQKFTTNISKNLKLNFETIFFSFKSNLNKNVKFGVRKSSDEKNPILTNSFKDYLRRQRSTDGSYEVDLPLKRQLSVQSEREVLEYIERVKIFHDE